MCKSARDSVAASVRLVAAALLFLPLPAMASDFTGFLTLYIAMPIFALTGLSLGVLLIFRRHCWVRVVGTVVAVPILLTGIGVAYVDTWRLWPQTTHSEPLLRATAVILCALVWLTLAALVWLLWRWPSPPRQTGTTAAVSQAPDSP